MPGTNNRKRFRSYEYLFIPVNKTESRITFYHGIHETKYKTIKPSSKQCVMSSHKCKEILFGFEWGVKGTTTSKFSSVRNAILPTFESYRNVYDFLLLYFTFLLILCFIILSCINFMIEYNLGPTQSTK